MKLFIMVCLIIVLILTPTPIFASPLITEVHPNPASGPEWVELFNPEVTALNLAGWKLEDHLSSPSTIFTFADQIIPALTYQVFELPSSKLNNTTDGVTLRNPTAESIDTMSYDSSELGYSWSLIPSLETWLATPPTPNQPAILPTPTPTPIPSPTPTPSPTLPPTPSPSTTPHPSPTVPPTYVTNLQASEVMACPTSDDTEWLEVYNPNPELVNLEGWQVQDKTGTSRFLHSSLPAQSLGILSWSGSLLNNTGDSVSLVTPAEQTLFTVELDPCLKAQSFIFFEGEWQLTTNVTKGLPNQGPSVSPVPTLATSEQIIAATSVTTPKSLATSSATLSLSKVKPPFAPPRLPWQLSVPTFSTFDTNQPVQLGLTATATQKWLVLSAIMGGTLLLASNSLGFYFVHHHHAQQSPATLTDAGRVHHSPSGDYPGQPQPPPFVFP